jgi:hypothetical protein
MSIAAGVDAHALWRDVGQSSIAVTFDLYGHLFPGNKSEAPRSSTTRSWHALEPQPVGSDHQVGERDQRS